VKELIKDKKRYGIPCIFFGKKLKSLVTKIRHKPYISSEKLGREYNCSSRTIRTTLKKLKYKKIKPRKLFECSREHKKQRLQWSKCHLNDDWANTIFCDESHVQLQANTIRFWHKKGKRSINYFQKIKRRYHFGELFL